MNLIIPLLVCSMVLLVGCSTEEIYQIERCPYTYYCETYNYAYNSNVIVNLSNYNSTYIVELAS